MKSACCKHQIVIQTDPKNCEYVIISGAERKTEEYDIEDAETFALPADEGRRFSPTFYNDSFKWLLSCNGVACDFVLALCLE